ncbi:MAG: hypothetical protein IJU07_07465 [Synergistaceae bacterium]|nr:hypothetical protein [Synergistaceae bacterium]
MATSTFDRPLVLEKDEDIERFWQVMNSEPKPIFRNFEVEKDMEECAELFKQIAENDRLH